MEPLSWSRFGAGWVLARWVSRISVLPQARPVSEVPFNCCILTDMTSKVWPESHWNQFLHDLLQAVLICQVVRRLLECKCESLARRQAEPPALTTSGPGYDIPVAQPREAPHLGGMLAVNTWRRSLIMGRGIGRCSSVDQGKSRKLPHVFSRFGTSLLI